MARGDPFTLANGSAWPNKTAAKNHFSAMLNKYEVGATVSDATHHAELLALVVAYDAVGKEWTGAKTGDGVTHFIKDYDDEPSRAAYSKPCFYVVGTSGSRTHFSTNKAIDSIASAAS